jgi:hypothetical protein
MAKNKPVVPEVDLEVNPSSNGLNLDGLQTDIYKFAGLVGEQKTLARSILDKVPNWLDGNVDKSVTERIDRALLLRHKEISYGEYGYVELNGAKQFVCLFFQKDGAIDPTIDSNGSLRKQCKNVMRIDADHALSYTGQQYGALKKEDADKYKVFGIWRKAGQQYCSNTKGKITTQIKELVNPGNTSRSSVADFEPHAKEVFAELKKRCRTSKDARGDTTANPDRFDGAVKAFWDYYNNAK